MAIARDARLRVALPGLWAGLGLPLGVSLAALATRGVSSQGIGFALPVAPLVVFTIVAALSGILAAISPARRASRLDVLEALKYE